MKVELPKFSSQQFPILNVYGLEKREKEEKKTLPSFFFFFFFNYYFFNLFIEQVETKIQCI
jgi:hypothetical protein